ncbi:rod shape-determining protein MreC [Acetobacteraceae bacterium]|nr:rod shape-determining protein MreC [Acetobacteraceae bacterium]
MLSVKRREFLASVTRTGTVLGAVFLLFAASIFPVPFEHMRLWGRSHVGFFYEWALFPQDCIDDLQHKISASLTLSSENKRLRLENQALNAERDNALQLQVENEHLKSLLHWSEIPAFGYVTGRVMGEEHGPYRHAVLMGWEGASKPPAVGSVALDMHGLVGRVTEVSPHALRILLIDDKASHVPVVGKKSASHAILGGKGEEGGLELAYYAQGAAPLEGEIVETLLKDGAVSGIAVGRVHYEGQGHPVVLPFADLRHLSILRVVDYAPLLQVAPGYMDGKIHTSHKRKKAG